MSVNTTPTKKNPFICPDCGGQQVAQDISVSPALDGPISDNPWAFVMRRIRCADCGEIIPAHLAERWNEITPEEAQRQWQERFLAHKTSTWRGRGWDLDIAMSKERSQRHSPRSPGQPFVSRRSVSAVGDLERGEIAVTVNADRLGIPEQPPATAEYLGRVEWAWSPAHNRVDAFWVEKMAGADDLWVLWYGGPDDNSWEEDGWMYAVAAVARQPFHSSVSAGRTLVAARWVADLEELEHGPFDFVAEVGLLRRDDFDTISSWVFKRPEYWTLGTGA